MKPSNDLQGHTYRIEIDIDWTFKNNRGQPANRGIRGRRYSLLP